MVSLNTYVSPATQQRMEWFRPEGGYTVTDVVEVALNEFLDKAVCRKPTTSLGEGLSCRLEEESGSWVCPDNVFGTVGLVAVRGKAELILPVSQQGTASEP